MKKIPINELEINCLYPPKINPNREMKMYKEAKIFFFDKSINKIIVGKTDINLPINKDKKGLPIELVISQINRKAGSQ